MTLFIRYAGGPNNISEVVFSVPLIDSLSWRKLAGSTSVGYSYSFSILDTHNTVRVKHDVYIIIIIIISIILCTVKENSQILMH